MQYSKVTGTDLSASRLVLGTDSFGTLVSEADAFALLDRYVEAGGNVIDTASVYADWLGLGKSISEKTIGKWLKARNNRSQVILATKGGHYDLDTQAPRLDYHSVREDFENSLRNLQTDYIDIYYLHKDDESQSPESLMDMLQEAAPAQQARYLGVSNWSYDRIRRANAYAREKGLRPIIASQIQHSIASANIDQFGITVMDAASYRQYAQDEMSIFAYSSQAKGFFAILEKGGAEALSEATRAMYWNEENCKRYQRLQVLAKEKNESVATLVLAALVSDPKVNTFAQIGPRTMGSLSASLMGADVCLTEAERRFLLEDERK